MRFTGARTPDCSPAPYPLLTPAPCAHRAVYQDEKAKKLDGVKSLIKWATMCQYMLIPTEEKMIKTKYPDELGAEGPNGLPRMKGGNPAGEPCEKHANGKCTFKFCSYSHA